MGIENSATISRDPRRNIAQEEGPDPRNRTLAEEEHLDHSHTVEPGRTHIQVAGVGRYLAGDTVQLVEPATWAVARKYLGG